MTFSRTRNYEVGRYLRVALLASVLSACLMTTALAQVADRSTEDEEPATSADQVIRGTYETKRSLRQHVLAFPATLVYGFTRPFKYVFTWSDQVHLRDRVLDLFLNSERTAGVYPSLDVGGDRMLAVGATGYHADAFAAGHAARVSFLFGGVDSYHASGHYNVPPTRERRYSLAASVGRNVDPEENYFVSARRRANARAVYSLRRTTAEAEAALLLRPVVWMSVAATFHSTDVSAASDETSAGSDALPVDASIAGFGSHRLGSIGASLVLDRRRGGQRDAGDALIGRKTDWNMRDTRIHSYAGALLDAGARVYREMGGANYTFLHYHLELQQFLPAPRLPKDRRFAFRGRLDKRSPLGDAKIPFYELSVIGGRDDLRGFQQDRFRDYGSLYFNLEYRYPIWDRWDGVVFLDEGQVFEDLKSINLSGFRSSVGAGVRIKTAGSFILRSEVAVSSETVRAVLSFSPNF